MSGELLLFVLAAGLAFCLFARGDFKYAASTQITGGVAPKQNGSGYGECLSHTVTVDPETKKPSL
jgi:hypothetical protein